MKKLMKKILIIVLLLIQLIPTMVTAQSGMNSDTGVITVNNAIVGKTYSVYEILKLESYDTEKNAYRYVTTDDWKEFIESATDYVTIENGYVTWKADELAAAQFSKEALDYAKKNSIKATSSQIAIEAEEGSTVTTVEFKNLNLGYYLVDSSLGALCGLNTTKPTAQINEKNTEPTVVKEVKENSTELFGEKNDAKIGDVVEFKTTITVGKGAEKYILYDTLSSGLTLISDSIIVNDIDATNYTITPNVEAGNFKIEFINDYLATLAVNTKIVITYSAILNENAVIEGVGNPNETYLEYGDKHETTHDTTITYTYGFNLEKIDSDGKRLDGAEFKLYSDNEGKNEIKLVYVKDETDNTGNIIKVYRVVLDTEEVEENLVIEVGTAKILGLDHDTYYLKETKQPEGYNILTSLVEVKVNSTTLTDNTITDITETYKRIGIKVTNLTGAELPSTGSVGTIIFVTIGTIMILAFGVLLVTKLRMSKTNIQS